MGYRAATLINYQELRHQKTSQHQPMIKTELQAHNSPTWACEWHQQNIYSMSIQKWSRV